MTYIIAQPCVDVKDKSCIEECPVEAIYYEDDVPGEWKQYGSFANEFFQDLGSPGGAAKVGATGKDAAEIQALPPKSE